MMTHDLRSPLHGISGSAALLEMMVPAGKVMTDRAFELVGTLNRSTKRMTRIVEDFLAMQAGVLEARIGKVSLANIVRELAEEYTDTARAKSIELAVEVRGDDEAIDSDAEMLNRALGNFVSNAIKYSPPETATLIRASREHDSALFEVIDGGVGLSDSDLEKAFVKFTRLSNRPTAGEISTGMGLGICKLIAIALKGEVGVRNNSPDPGATFWLRVPVSQASA